MADRQPIVRGKAAASSQSQAIQRPQATGVSAVSALDLARERSDLLPVCLDPGGDRLVVFSEERAQGMKTRDLVWLVEKGAHRRRRRTAALRTGSTS